MPFREIRGQDRAVAQLRRAWTAERLPQAYCFAGPPGVGKRTTALALAQAINCLAPDSGEAEGRAGDACGACIPCRKIARGEHPDVTVVQPEEKTVITVDQIRELTARASLRAYEGKAKIWIVDPADQMQEPAANAFLKTLEEPCGASLFVLVTATPSALLPTIRSRCQVVRFDSLGEGPLQEILLGHGRTAEQSAAAAQLAGGSAELALALDVAGVRALRDRIVSETWDALGSLPKILGQAERLAKDRTELEAALEVLAAASRDMAVAKVGGSAAGLLPPDRRATAERLAAVHSMAAILGIHAAQVEAQRVLARYANPRLTAERMLLRMRQAIGRRQGE
jgi:DNA polymerase III subunit delta'